MKETVVRRHHLSGKMLEVRLVRQGHARNGSVIQVKPRSRENNCKLLGNQGTFLVGDVWVQEVGWHMEGWG